MSGGNPFPGDVGAGQISQYLKSPDRVAGLMTEDVGGMGASPAAIFADVVTVIRADQKRLAAAQGVDLQAERMTEARAADLLGGLVDGGGIEIVQVFNEMAEQRDQMLQAALDDEEYHRFMKQKTAVMHTDDPDTFGADLDPVVESGLDDSEVCADGGE